jgi:hypothetical protein
MQRAIEPSERILVARLNRPNPQYESLPGSFYVLGDGGKCDRVAGAIPAGRRVEAQVRTDLGLEISIAGSAGKGVREEGRRVRRQRAGSGYTSSY